MPRTPKLNAIVDRVLVYNPKEGEIRAKWKHRADAGSAEFNVLFSPRKKSSDD